MKHIIVINGIAESGKDTVCDIVKKRYKTKNISSIDLVKELAKRIGWDGNKDEKGRKLLSELKQLLTAYNDAPMKDCLTKCGQFLSSGAEILFVHIREPEEITRFIVEVQNYYSSIPVKICSLLVSRKQANRTWNNVSDDGVSHYDYDYIIENNGTMKELKKTTLELFDSIMIDKKPTSEKKIRKLAYELYKTYWMGRIPVASRLIVLRNYYKEDPDYPFEEYLEEVGYFGRLYASFNEFMENEYLDVSFMKKLFHDTKIFEEYEQDILELIRGESY